MISLIAAIGSNNELGKNNQLIWNLPNDLKFFKNITTNKTVVMGYNTYLSIGRLLPKRKNIIITSKDILIPTATVYHSIEELLDVEKNEDLFIIGGAKLYESFINIADTMYLTEINATDDSANAYFPVFNSDEWEKEIFAEDTENDISYQHVLYRRLK